MKLSLCVLAVAMTATLSMNAHALCMNPDGSLDDPSMGVTAGDKAVLPSCLADQTIQTKVVTQIKTTNGNVNDKSVSATSDCRTSSDESQMGYIGAAEVLPACGT